MCLDRRQVICRNLSRSVDNRQVRGGEGHIRELCKRYIILFRFSTEDDRIRLSVLNENLSGVLCTERGKEIRWEFCPLLYMCFFSIFVYFLLLFLFLFLFRYGADNETCVKSERSAVKIWAVVLV